VVALAPMIEAIRTDVMGGAERIHADDTTVPVLAKLKTVTGRIWTYVRDDRPFSGQDPPAALFYYSRNRAEEHPRGHLAGYVGLMQADAFDGYNQLDEPHRKPAPILEAACWRHGRRKFVDPVKQGEAPIASEAVRRIDMLFEIERSINGKTPEQRLVVRRERSRPPLPTLKSGCASNAHYSPPRTILPKRSTTSSTAAQRSPASSTMAASVLRTTPPNERCEVWRSEERIGPLPVQIPAEIAPPLLMP
jgi:hypothetical protein